MVERFKGYVYTFRRNLLFPGESWEKEYSFIEEPVEFVRIKTTFCEVLIAAGYAITHVCHNPWIVQKADQPETIYLWSEEKDAEKAAKLFREYLWHKQEAKKAEAERYDIMIERLKGEPDYAP